MSFFQELKRRNVFRVAAAYLVTGWLLIEIGSTLEETLHLPDWADTLLAFFLIIGFPIALFVSWAYEITPEGIKREKDLTVTDTTRSATARKLNQLIVVVMALGLVYFALDKWVLSQAPDTAVQTAAAPGSSVQAAAEVTTDTHQASEPLESTPSVAVLPFVNMSADVDNEYFSDGISEELLNLLVKVDGLRVPSRTSSFAFKGQNTDIREIARQLDVGHILEGSVRKAGNRVRVTAQLIDVSSDSHLWSETYDRELADIFAIQDEIAGHIVEALQIALGASLEQDTPTQDLAAYELYLQGRYLFQQRGPGLKDAERLLLQAVEKDPEFAQAWAALAMTYVVLPNYLGINWREYKTRAMDAAQRALDIDPGLAEPKLALAQFAQRDLRWVDSASLYEAVVAEHPRNALAHLWSGITSLQAGYVSKALAHFQQAVDLDPVAGINLDWLARALVMNGRYEEALDPALKGFRLGRAPSVQAVLFYGIETGNDARAHEFLAELGSDAAFFQRALELYQRKITAAEGLAILESQGAPDRIKQYWNHLAAYLSQEPVATYARIKEIYPFDDSIIGLVWWKQGRWFRQSPEMKQFVKDFKLLDLWRERGWPDLCRPLDEDDFECD